MAKTASIESGRVARGTARPDNDTRDMLLRATSDLMIAEGTHDVSLHAIARHAGVTAPLIKYYFGGKDGLLVALAERDTARSLAQLDDLLEMQVDPATKLRFHICGIGRTYARFPYLNGLLDNLLRDDMSEGAERLKASFVQPLIAAQRVIIEDGIAAGQFRPIDPDMAYFMIVGASQYIFGVRVAHRLMTHGGSMDDATARDYAAFVADIVLAGLAVR